MATNSVMDKNELSSPARYRLSEAAILTLDREESGVPVSAYIKNRKTGLLYRIGREEFFLLNELSCGLSPDALVSPLRSRMQLSITAAAIRQFAEQMVERGILEYANAPVLEDASVEPDSAGWPATAAEEMESDDFSFDEGEEDDLDALVFYSNQVVGETASSAGEGDSAGPGTVEKDTPEIGIGLANPRVSRRESQFRDAKSKPRAAKDMDLPLFDPSGLLWGLNTVFGPIARFLSVLTLPLGILAILTVFYRLDEVLDTFFATRGMLSLAGILAISMVTVNLVSRLVVGVIMQREGAEVRRFGITFLYFLVPRFAVEMTDLHNLDRDGKIHVFAAVLRTRFLLFALCTVLWAVTRQSGSLVSDLAAIIGQISLFTFFISAFPLLSGEGYRLMCAYFDQPMLRERSLAYIFGLGNENKGPTSAAKRWAFVLYGIGSLLTSAFLITLLTAYASTALEGRFGGTGVAIFLGLFALVVVWFIVTRGRSKRLREQIISDMAAKRKAQAGKNGNPAGYNLPVPVSGGALQRRATPPPVVGPDRGPPLYRPLPEIYGSNTSGERRKRWIRRGIVLALLAGFVYVAFLPYSYETGGDFEILPDDRVQVVARVSNELADMFVEEGDIVQQGDLLATQIYTRELHNLKVSEANLSKARAQLQRLRDGSTPEEIHVAEEQVRRYEAELPFLKSEAERAKKLGKKGQISVSQKERMISDYETAKAELRTARANLEQVRAQAQDSEIAIAQADVDRLESEVAYNQIKLNQTRIVAPASGRVVFDSDEPVPGKYLEIGDLLMEIEDHTVARAEIKVPEADVGLIELREQVRLKIWARPDEEHIGVVSAIAPVAEAEEFGQVVRIKTSLPNEHGFFRPGMTGYAKIDGQQMFVWEAYSRLFVRFFLIEVWGWIP